MAKRLTRKIPYQKMIIKVDMGGVIRKQYIILITSCFILGGCISQTFEAVKSKNLSLAQNCSGLTASSAALINAQSYLTMSGLPISDLCSQSAYYQCSKRVFTPDVDQNKESTQNECINSTAFGNICMNIKELEFSTKAAFQLDQTDAEAFKAGGEYNYSEYECYHAGIKKEGQFFLTSKSNTLSGAVESLKETCRSLQ